jgi:hypothetical protein
MVRPLGDGNGVGIYGDGTVVSDPVVMATRKTRER